MRRYSITFFAVFLGLALFVAGCAKKSNEPTNATGSGFDSLSNTEDLAQLPQANSTNQQAAVEALPIETSPVTQGAPAPAVTAPGAAAQTANTAAATLAQPKKIQTALKNAGLYNGPIDGKIGPASKRAIEAFQKSHGLKVDGKVGPKTWAALEPSLNGPSVSENTAPSAPAASSGN